MDIIVAPLTRLTPYYRNPRHNEKAVDVVAGSLKEFQFRQPIVVDKDWVIVAGHTRYQAAKQAGLTEVPVHVADDLTPAQIKAYRLMDNRSHDHAEWDDALLALEIQDLDGQLDLALTGFTQDELDQLVALEDDPRLDADSEDAVPEPEEKEPTAQPGQVWQLGRHRVMCGDATVSDDVAKLMDGDQADVIFTDPPYGMAYGGGRAKGDHVRRPDGGVHIKAHGAILGDELQGEALVAFLHQALSNAVAWKTDSAAVYVCLTWRTYTAFHRAIEQCGLTPKACIVWDKQAIGLGFSDYRPRHEFILYCPGPWYGDQSQADVITCSRGHTGDYVHPTQKPVALIETLLQNSSRRGDTVLDVFGGSGSTLIACEKTGRHARIMERDPKYIDVMIERWQKITGKKAKYVSH